MQSGLAFGCGQCMHCRINRRRHWANRLMLESSSHEFNAFVTLTYDDEHLPDSCGCKTCQGKHITGTLRPRDPTDWLKRVRFALGEKERVIRFYLVGEYGDENFRPHYHLMLFGASQFDHALLCEKWSKGLVQTAECNQHTCSYIAGYVTKKMTKTDDDRLQGRHPEYSRQSNRPGIGAYAADCIGDTLTTKEGSYGLIQTHGESPSEILVSGKRQPLHPYLKERIRKKVGAPRLGINSYSCQQAKARLQELLGTPEALPSDQAKQALINKTEHLARARLKRQAIWQFNKKGRHL
ncbi:MAG: replication initiator protein [Microviridae sp.]|nr:MAG: replication initiator protein [Microviridae sp.]